MHLRCAVLLFTVVLLSPSVSNAGTLVSGSGLVRLQTVPAGPPLGGTVAEAARSHVLANREALGWTPPSVLSSPRVFSTRFGASVQFSQQLDGVEVDGARVVVTLDRNKRVVQVASSLVPARQVEARWTVSLEDALRAAAGKVPWPMKDVSGRPYGGVKRMFFARGDVLRAGYLVFVPSLQRERHWHAGVDAGTGEVLWVRDWALSADEADVFERSPGGKNGGVGVTPVTRVTLPYLPPGREGGHLTGERVVAINCCPSEGCDATKPARRIAGTTSFGGQDVTYDLAVCDQTWGASNDVTKNPAGSYVFAPHDPPVAAQVSQAEPADWDLFSQVNAYYQANKAYDFIRSLSTTAQPLFPGEALTPFQMRDVARGKVPAVVSNMTLPNFQEALTSLFVGGVARNQSLQRFDNAQFLPREQFQLMLFPGVLVDADTLVLYQGNKTDFGYDGSILWHEFGHGVIHSTAGIKFDGASVDAWSANNEGAALHEGVADYFAAALGNQSEIGEYVGARNDLGAGSESTIRNLENAHACPDVLWGEAHQDSLHVSGALWQARKELFQGKDGGQTFDAAVYAALVSLTPESDFAAFVEAVVNHVKLAFPSLPGAEGQMRDVFKTRGVVGCSKALAVTAPSPKRRMYGIASPVQAGLAPTSLMPGPFQFKLAAPKGARSVSFTASAQSGFGQAPPSVTLLARTGEPVTFTRQGDGLEAVADGKAPSTASGSTVRGSVALSVPCGAEVYLAIAGTGQNPSTLSDLSVNLEPAESCAPPAPPGTPGTGEPPPEQTPEPAPSDTTDDGDDRKDEDSGCGCGSGSADAVAWAAALGLLAIVARRRKTVSVRGARG